VCTLARPFSDSTQRHCSNISGSYRGLCSYIHVSFECVPREGCFSDSTQRHLSNILVSYMRLFSYIQVSFECVPREGHFLIPHYGGVSLRGDSARPRFTIVDLRAKYVKTDLTMRPIHKTHKQDP